MSSLMFVSFTQRHSPLTSFISNFAIKMMFCVGLNCLYYFVYCLCFDLFRAVYATFLFSAVYVTFVPLCHTNEPLWTICFFASRHSSLTPCVPALDDKLGF